MVKQEKQQEIVDILMDMIPGMVAMSVGMKVISDAYKENPNMFLAYKRSKLQNFIFNCRM